MSTTEFGQLLRHYRTRDGISQTELARRVKVDKSYISRLERGERDIPTREFIISIIKGMEMNDYDANLFLLNSGCAPINDNSSIISDPILSLINDIFQDDRITESELSPLKEYARLLDQLRNQRFTGGQENRKGILK